MILHALFFFYLDWIFVVLFLIFEFMCLFVVYFILFYSVLKSSSQILLLSILPYRLSFHFIIPYLTSSYLTIYYLVSSLNPFISPYIPTANSLFLISYFVFSFVLSRLFFFFFYHFLSFSVLFPHLITSHLFFLFSSFLRSVFSQSPTPS